MKIIHNLKEYHSEQQSAVTIGKFDGVHRGHMELIREVVHYTKESETPNRPVQSVVIALDSGKQMLLTPTEREAVLSACGVDVLIECPVDQEFLAMTAEDFIQEILERRLHCVHVTVGEDFRFGRGRAGDGTMLANVGKTDGFSVSVIPELYYREKIISSTRIRAAITAGEMELARGMLGYDYSISGEVLHGRALGRTIGIPTANLRPDARKLLPPNGVYYTKTRWGDRILCGVTNIGMRPTVEGHHMSVETHYLDYNGDLYGENLEVRLLHFARPEQKFAGIEELQAQIQRDRAGAKKYLL